MFLFKFILNEPVTERAKEKYNEVYLDYTNKIDYCTNTFPYLENFDKEDVRSVLHACLLKACQIHDEKKGKLNTIFWTLSHRFLSSLKTYDRSQKRSTRDMCEECKGAGCIYCNNVGTLPPEERPVFNEKVDEFFYQDEDENFTTDPDLQTLYVLLKDVGVAEYMRLTDTQKKICRYLIEGRTLSSLRDELSQWTITQEIGRIRSIVRYAEPLRRDTDRWLRENRSREYMINETREKYNLDKSNTQYLLQRLKVQSGSV